MLCVSCAGYPLEACVYKGQRVAICARCGGLWCEVSQWDVSTWGEPPPEPIPHVVPTAGDAAARSCGQCRSRMAIVPIPEIIDLRLDRCLTCGGVWFDRGEWDKIDAMHVWKGQLEMLDRPTNWGEWFFQMFLRLPVEFNIRPRSTPWMTLLIIAVCTIVNIIMMDPVWAERMMDYAADGPQALTWAKSYTLVTHLFLHDGWLHLLTNLYLLYILGDNVEDVLGPVLFLLFYLMCGAAAAAAQILGTEMFGPPLPLIGASGAISGVIAAYLILYQRSQLTFVWFFWQYKLPAGVWILVWLLMQLVFLRLDPSSRLTGVGWWAHVGGFVAGLFLILPFRRRLIASHSLLDLLDQYKLRKPMVEAKVASV